MTTPILWKDIKDTLSRYDIVRYPRVSYKDPDTFNDLLRDVRPVALDTPSELVCAVLQANLVAALKEIKTAADYLILLTDNPNHLTLRTVEGSSVRIGANVRQGTEGHAIAVPYKALAQAVPTWSNDRVDITFAPKWRKVWHITGGMLDAYEREKGLRETRVVDLIREDDGLRFRCGGNVAHIVALTVPAPRTEAEAVLWSATVDSKDLRRVLMSGWTEKWQTEGRFTRGVRVSAADGTLTLAASNSYTALRWSLPADTSPRGAFNVRGDDWRKLDRAVKDAKRSESWTFQETAQGFEAVSDLGTLVKLGTLEEQYPTALDTLLNSTAPAQVTFSLAPYRTRPKLNKKGKEIGREADDDGIEGLLNQVELYARDNAYTSRWTITPDGVTVFGRSQERGETTVNVPALTIEGVTEPRTLHMSISYALNMVKTFKALGADTVTLYACPDGLYLWRGNDAYGATVGIQRMSR